MERRCLYFADKIISFRYPLLGYLDSLPYYGYIKAVFL